MTEEKIILDYDSYPIYVVSRYTAILAFLGHSLFLTIFIIFKIKPLIYVNIVSCFIFIVAYFLNRFRFHRLILNLTLVEIISHAFYATYYLGWNSGFYIYILCLLPLIFNYRILLPYWRNLLLVCLIACIIILNLKSRTWPEMHLLSSVIISNLQLMNLIIAFSVFFLLSAAYSVSAMDLEFQLRLKNEALDSSSRLDPLTSLSNRRDILEKIDFEKEKMIRNSIQCCFLLADIDYFKRVNDRFGHDFGDYILKQISDLFVETLRKQDHVCRWGGEEFLIVLPDTGLMGAKETAEKIRKLIEQRPFNFKDITTHITITFGVTLYDPLQDVDVSIKKADELLYIGKKKGRNRVESL